MFPTSLVSSANMDAKLVMFWSISLIKIRKRIGPKTVPWGIPDITSDSLEMASSETIIIIIIIIQAVYKNASFCSIESLMSVLKCAITHS